MPRAPILTQIQRSDTRSLLPQRSGLPSSTFPHSSNRNVLDASQRTMRLATFIHHGDAWMHVAMAPTW
jgi:hypothetical protein